MNSFIFIYSGATGKQHGYEDAWDNPNIFSYTGEGRVGKMTMTKGNLALGNHLVDGKRVFLFTFFKKGLWKFECELVFHEVAPFETPDTNGKMRIGLKFFFQRKGTQLPEYASQVLKEGKAEGQAKFLVDIPTEKQSLITTRVGQGAYRKRIIHRWEYKCAVTGFHHQQVLIASHIVPWRHSDDTERLDVSNGILLSPTFDALFDRHLISFENSGKIILSDQIDTKAYAKIGITGKEQIRKLSSENLPYLEKHRDLALVK